MKAVITFTLAAACLAAGCGEGSDKDKSSESTNSASNETDQPWAEPSGLDDALVTYADIAFASYSDSLTTAKELDDAVVAFVEAPSQDLLDAAREAWLAAREPYLQTEVFRFYAGPIDNEDDGPEGLLNAWPLDENYIDYVADDDTAGLVNDLDFEITKKNLVAQNEKGGEKNIATGYHAIEFLLWGQDTSDDGPGDRPYTDYVEGDEGTAVNPDRRGLYLTTLTALLQDHLQSLVDAWDPEQSGNYREGFIEGGMDSLEKALTGMIILSGFETGGERLQAALDAKDQEEEHSCFSDNTHRDMILDAQGVQNVFLGKYRSIDGSQVSGACIDDLIAEVDKDMADELKELIGSSVDAANALQPPFDQEIAPGNDEGHERVQAVIDALATQEAYLEEVFRGYDFAVPQPE